MGKFKVVFRRIRGRIIPIQIAKKIGAPDEFQKVMHARRAREFAKDPAKKFDMLSASFWRTAKEESKQTGSKIARRLAKLNRKK